MICNKLTREQSNSIYADVLKSENGTDLRQLCREDLFFLLSIGFKRKDVDCSWLYERCREVEREPDGMLDLWSREFYKSTIITYALSIQDILKDPNVTIGIFSHTRPIAKGFLSQIKRELEDNAFLQGLFPEILYSEPRRLATSWSLDNGLIVKRSTNPKEPTISAFGLVDGQPTSKHFSILVYDDVVTKESVSNPDQIKNVTDSWALSLNLGAKGGKVRYIGTRYHFNDTYRHIIEREAARPRIHTATKNGQWPGEPVFLSLKELEKKRREMGPYVFCLGKGTKVMLSDFKNAPIESIRPGDELLGLKFGRAEVENEKPKTSLVRSTVLRAQVRHHKAYLFTFEDGRSIVATENHKWWTGRVQERGTGRKVYRPLGFRRSQLSYVCKIFDIEIPEFKNLTEAQQRAVGYLAGMMDADGSVNGATIVFSQSISSNIEVCERIKSELECLGFAWGEPISNSRHPADKKILTDNIQTTIYVKGGRQEYYRFLTLCASVKSKQIINILYKHGTRFLGYKYPPSVNKLISVESLGVKKVYNIETETGNYIAEGYVSSNSAQMLQNPSADSAMGFREEWLFYYDELRNHEGWNYYIVCDPAGEKKKTNDYTVMLVFGLGPDRNYYLVDAVRDRLNLTERAKKLFEFHRKYRPLAVGYEKYGMQSDIEHFQYEMEIQNYRFVITPLAGRTAKEDRIRKLVPIFESERFWMPHKLYFMDYEGNQIDFVHEFVQKEYLAFPVAVHDDMLDCAARILDVDLKVEFPETISNINKSITYNDNLNVAKMEYDVLD